MKKEKVNHLLSLLQGFIIGFFEIIPFLKIDFIKNLIRVRENSNSFTLLLKNKWSYYLGFTLGFTFFYALPLNYLKENYLTTLGYVFLPIIVLNLISSIIIIFLNKKSLINILMNLIISISIAIGFYFIDLTSFSALNNYSTYLIIMLITIIFSFISAYSNISLSSLLIITLIYFPLANRLNKLALFQDIKSTISLLIFLLLGVFVGFSIKYIFNNKKKISKESSSSFSIPLFAFFLIYDIIYINGKSPIPMINDSKYATIILFITSLFASIIVTLIFVINSLYIEYNLTNYKRLLTRKLNK